MTGGRLYAPGRTRSRLEPAPHIQFRTDIVRISRAHAEPDVLMPDRVPALLADHPADDAVTIPVMTQRDRRTAPAVQPLIPQDSIAARTGKKSRPISVSKYS